jgi:hypothetical protein
MENTKEQMLWLAEEMSRSSQADTFEMDWGNIWIKCCSWELKNILRDMAKDYVRLRELEPHLQLSLVELVKDYIRLRKLESDVKSAIM